MNELQIEYLSLKPPIRHFDIEDATNYQIWFRKEELDIIQNSEYPEYILKLDVADREKMPIVQDTKFYISFYVRLKIIRTQNY